MESQEYSILPDEISQRVRKFWGISPVKDKAYLLNISGRADGEFQLIESKVKPTKLSIPKYLKEYYKSRKIRLPVTSLRKIIVNTLKTN